MQNNPSSFGSSESIADVLNMSQESLLSSNFAENLSNSVEMDKPHRLHIYSTKHNTHITFVQPSRLASQTMSSGISGTSASSADKKKQVDVLMSLSTGNIGFRKAGRGSYDAAYQLAAFTLKQIQEKGMLRDISRLEVVLRGFGAGREACTKALLGSEGRNIRHKITSVVDATRLKQGGTRSKKPRRLG
ncbi:37S ribosomal S18, mitochondrial [Lecanosticta acicola]|uniref:Small ribosomal subunit protein uS11m n=1 Tax=Lecanosticta acicola TaxID=111012 RepID=A0AAI8YY09_9PEZI|nr:37S ribosomal S18, mitochondrial [Lecanosticta acicola]